MKSECEVSERQWVPCGRTGRKKEGREGKQKKECDKKAPAGVLTKESRKRPRDGRSEAKG
jgi:hypothetical protein